jgi:hypothetical protein
VDAAAKRVVRLRVIGGETLELRDGVPRSRAECPTTRPCGHVQCRYHLWFMGGRDRPGRKPRDPKNLRPSSLDLTHQHLQVAARAAAINLRPSRLRDVLERALRKLKLSGADLREYAELVSPYISQSPQVPFYPRVVRA